jgi:hypothetical protein
VPKWVPGMGNVLMFFDERSSLLQVCVRACACVCVCVCVSGCVAGKKKSSRNRLRWENNIEIFLKQNFSNVLWVEIFCTKTDPMVDSCQHCYKAETHEGTERGGGERNNS